VGVGFADRAAVVVALGFSQDLWVLHIQSIREKMGAENIVKEIKQ